MLFGSQSIVQGQSTASIEGQVVDQDGAVIPNAEITASNRAIAIERLVMTDIAGRYQIASLPVGNYRLEIRAKGFETQILEQVRIEVARRTTQDFQLHVGDVSLNVTVNSRSDLIEHSTVSVGHVIDSRMVQEIPLNGRYFLDLGLLVPGSLTPPQSGSSTIPVRGSGSFAINTAGNREEAVNYMIN